MSSSAFSKYDLHYRRMGNAVPDWAAAESSPAVFACKAEWLPSDKRARILDVGCGWGSLLMSLWAAGYRNIEGVEISPEQASVAQRASGGRVPISRADAFDYLKEHTAQYDVVVLYDVVEHMDHSKALQLLRLVRQSLKPGGRVVVRVPNASSLLASYSRYLDVTHVTMYTEYSLMQLLDQAGFENHVIVADEISAKRSIWKWWKPWRGLSASAKLNRLIHRFFYFIRGQSPKPHVFGYNVEVYSFKIDHGGDTL
jgi:2-polyprenyl-3-methyl-5-hydroxy-6-metoxy-1,4-benzoquinol methylase